MVQPLWETLWQFLKRNVHTYPSTQLLHSGTSVPEKRKLEWVWEPAHCGWMVRQPMSYYSVIKSNKLLIHEAVWNLQRIMLSEGGKKSQKVTYCMILFLQCSWNDRITEMENRLVIARGKGGSSWWEAISSWELMGLAVRNPCGAAKFCILAVSVSIPWLPYWTIVLPDVIIGRNWAKGTNWYKGPLLLLRNTCDLTITSR